MDELPTMPLGRGRRRLQLRLPPGLLEAVERCARQSEVPAGALVRLLLEDALADRPATLRDALRARQTDASELPPLACLVAIEHVRHLLEEVLAQRDFDRSKA